MFAQALARDVPSWHPLRLGRHRRHFRDGFDHGRAPSACRRADPAGSPRIFGWNTRRDFQRALIRLVLFGLMAPFAAALIERYGVRRVVLTAIGLIVFGPHARAGDERGLDLIVLWGSSSASAPA